MIRFPLLHIERMVEIMTRDEMKKQTMERAQAERSEKVVAIAFFATVSWTVALSTLALFVF